MLEGSVSLTGVEQTMRALETLGPESSHYLYLARTNYYAISVLYAIAIALSAVSTIMTLRGWTGPYLATATSLPAAILLITNTFKFNEKAQWHYEKMRRLTALYRLSDIGEKQPKEIVEEWNKIDEEMDERWPTLSPLPALGVREPH
jgi:hypothetical protein